MKKLFPFLSLALLMSLACADDRCPCADVSDPDELTEETVEKCPCSKPRPTREDDLGDVDKCPCSKPKPTREEAPDVVVPEMTEEEAVLLDDFGALLNKTYVEIDLHSQIEAALQQVADENPDAFAVALKFRGADLPDGTRVLPVPTYFLIK